MIRKKTALKLIPNFLSYKSINFIFKLNDKINSKNLKKQWKNHEPYICYHMLISRTIIFSSHLTFDIYTINFISISALVCLVKSTLKSMRIHDHSKKIETLRKGMGAVITWGTSLSWWYNTNDFKEVNSSSTCFLFFSSDPLARYNSYVS